MRSTRRQTERQQWTAFVDGERSRDALTCACGAPIPADRLARRLKSCSKECGKAAQTAKYGGKRVMFNGREYPSQRQANVARDLQMLAAAGKIRELEEEKRITLVEGRPGLRGIFYYADFTYYDEQNVFHVLDAKGMRTAVFSLKKQLAALLLNITIEEV